MNTAHTTFDEVLPNVQDWLKTNINAINLLLNTDSDWLLINRDLFGRVRIILPARFNTDDLSAQWNILVSALMSQLGDHAYPLSTAILYETEKEYVLDGTSHFLVEGYSNIWIVDRLATESDWSHIKPEKEGTKRVVYFSIKGGVGRSTALAASAWKLAQEGKRVLVIDLDLESPGLSSALLPDDRQPVYGITDWLVEDLVDNGATILESMRAISPLSRDGEIHVVPAHGENHGEYISKLGRVWMPKINADGSRELWSTRLCRLLGQLEEQIQPDITLIDSRSGIDDIASACITELGANQILLFALEGNQTWNGYRMLFEQWQRANVTFEIRERLKIVAALAPELDTITYTQALRSHSYDVFCSTVYDTIAPADPATIGLRDPNDFTTWRVDSIVDGWSFDETDNGAPHYPLVVNWHRNFAALTSLHGRLTDIDPKQIDSVFGQLIDGISSSLLTQHGVSCD